MDTDVKRVERLKEDLQEMRYRPALLIAAAFTAMFAFASVGSMVAGRTGHVLVIVTSLPLSLFTMPLLDTIEDPVAFALVLYGLNFVFGLVFWFLSILVTTNFNLFLARRKLDYLLLVIVAVIVLCAFTFKELRGYGFFIGLEGKAAWKDGLPRKRVYVAATSARGEMIVSGMGWVAHFHRGHWVNFKVPGKSRRFADSLVSLPDDRFLAKFGSDIYEITHTHWTRIPVRRSSGALAVNRNNEVVLFSVEGVQVLRGLAFEPVEVNADCVPNDRTVFADSRGWLWSGGKLGSLACVYDGKSIVEVKVRGAPENAPAGDSVTSLVEGPDLVLYAGTEKGALYRIVDRVAERLPLATPSDAGRVSALLIESRTDLVAVYAEAGLFRVRPAEGAIAAIPFDEIRGLKHLCCLVRDGTGHLWLGTNKGLIKFK